MVTQYSQPQCPCCQNPMVKAKATDFGEEYDYCRHCKKELKEMNERVSHQPIEAKSWVVDILTSKSIPFVRYKDDIVMHNCHGCRAKHSLYIHAISGLYHCVKCKIRGDFDHYLSFF